VLRRVVRGVSRMEDVAAPSGRGAARRCPMIRHLIRLGWNRKRSNALVVLEILLCFIVVFGVLVFGVAMADNVRRPVGYSTTDVWNIEFGRDLDEGGDPKALETIDRLLRVTRGLAPVEAV